MAELTNELIQQIIATHDTVVQLRTVLLGANGGTNGLCKKVDEVCKSHYDLKRKFYIVLAFMVGSGALGTGIWAMLK